MKKKKKSIKKDKTFDKKKEGIIACFKEEDYSGALEKSNSLIKEYPKNYYGYLTAIKAQTRNFNLYLNDEELKELKKTFEDVKKLDIKKEDKILEKEIEEYFYDYKEVDNLKKVKKEIISKELMKKIYESSITFINQNIMTANLYRLDGKKIKNIYDFINGIFFLLCLIFNLINRNYLLILTLPFGIFGIINIYSFIDMNFLKKGKKRSEKIKINNLIDLANKRVSTLREQIKKTDETLEFLYDQKRSIILKIPASFADNIKEEISNNEKEEGSSIFSILLENDAFSFTNELNKKTNIDANDIEKVIKEHVKREDDELSLFINSKLAERKNKQNELVYTKKISIYNIILTIILLIVSVFCIINLAKNFYEVNYDSFVLAFIVGIISMLIYNIDSGKHKSFLDASFDNLLSCVFKTSLAYNLVYFELSNELKLTYGFIQMPLIFALILIGFVLLVTLFKYNYYLKRLTKLKV